MANVFVRKEMNQLTETNALQTKGREVLGGGPVLRTDKKNSEEGRCKVPVSPGTSLVQSGMISLRPSLARLPGAKEMRLEGRLEVDTADGKGVYPAAALEAAQHLLEPGKGNQKWKVECLSTHLAPSRGGKSRKVVAL